jgi:hypothetical protein
MSGALKLDLSDNGMVTLTDESLVLNNGGLKRGDETLTSVKTLLVEKHK